MSESNSNPFLTNDNSESRGVPQYQPYNPPYNSNNPGGEYQHITFPVPQIPGYGPLPSNNNNNNTISNPPPAYIPESSFNSYTSNAYIGGGLSTQSSNAYSNSGNQTYNNNDDDDSSDSSSEVDDTENISSIAAANPGIETSDPNKLNQLTPEMIKIHKRPNGIRFLFRFATFLTSIGALMFMVGTKLASKRSTPSGANTIAIVFNYIVSSFSIIVSLFFLILYCSRRWFRKNKIPRWLLISIDLVFGVSYGCLMVFLIKGFSCKPGSENGWCDFYNTSIFFNVMCFLLYAISFFWDIFGPCKFKK